MKNYVLIWLSVLCTSCATDYVKNSSGEIFSWDKPGMVKASDLLADARFIPLEATEESLIGEASHLKIFEDRVSMIIMEWICRGFHCL